MKKGQKHGSREEYWDGEYAAYWAARVEEANQRAEGDSRVVPGDCRSSSDEFYLEAIGLLDIEESDRVLELGCGFGRSLPVLSEISGQVSALDISKQMINIARESCEEDNVTFHVSPSEDLPFAANSFDSVVCFAAFDAMYQSAALIEIGRVCRMGARVLITGKNNNYLDDDIAALEAEEAARKKNHPNYFTDVRKLVSSLPGFGFDLEIQRFYLKRGDLGHVASSEVMPPRFYEYLLVLKKVAESNLTEGFSISEIVSRTFARRESSDGG